MPDARAYQCPVCGAFAEAGDRSCRHCATALATLRCGECFELSFPDALHCRGCGRELGLALAPADSALQCPDCHKPLKAFRDANGTLLACETCGAQLVTHPLLRALLESREVLGAAVPSGFDAPRHNPLQQPVRYRPCPSCGQIMHRKNFGGTSGIIVDVCTLHGTLFDAGELPRVLAFVRRGGLVRAQAQARGRPPATASASFSAAAGPAALAPASEASGLLDLFTFIVDLLT